MQNIKNFPRNIAIKEHPLPPGKSLLRGTFYFMEHWKNLSEENLQEVFESILYTEEWRPCPKYEGFYEVSSFGRVRTIGRIHKHVNGNSFYRKGKIKAQVPAKEGYPLVSLSKFNKGNVKTVHRLVAEAFLDNPENHPDVNHKKGIVTDNRVHQIEWCSTQYNCWHAYRVLGRKAAATAFLKGAESLKAIPIVQLTMDGLYIKTWPCAVEVKNELGFNHRHICSVCKGRYGRKSSHGYRWLYLKDYQLLQNK